MRALAPSESRVKSGRVPIATRREIVAQLVELRKQFWLGNQAALPLLDGRALTHLGELVTYVAWQYGVAWRTVYKWMADFEKGGAAGLADRPRGDRGISRYWTKNLVLALFVQTSLLADPGLSARALHKMICQEWPGRPPSETTLRTYLNSLRGLSSACRRNMRSSLVRQAEKLMSAAAPRDQERP